jgi:hypothetical protein
MDSPEGHRNSDSAREQVFLRRSTRSASAGDYGGPRLSTGRDTCFLDIVRRPDPTNSLVDSVIAGLCALRSNGEPPPSDEPGVSEPSKYLIDGIAQPA